MSGTKNTLCIGSIGTASVTVTQSNTAEALGSGLLPVFGTPALLALLEEAAVHAVADALPAGASTVGAAMTLSHTSPTPVGMQVRAEAELSAIDGRKLTFACKAYDEAGEIGCCEQTRFIVDCDRFMEKVSKKRG